MENHFEKQLNEAKENIEVKIDHKFTNFIRVEGIQFSPSQKLEIFNALKQNKNLKKLSIYNQAFSAEDGRALTEALKNNKQLQTLTIRDCDITKTKGNFFTDLTKGLDNLKNISLYGVEIDKEQFIALAEGLKDKKQLSDLFIKSEIDDQELQTLADILKDKKIKSLHLQTLKINEVGVSALTDALKDNKQLRNLDIGHPLNQISDKGLKDLVNFVGKANIPEFSLPCNQNTSKDTYNMLANITEKNRNIISLTTGFAENVPKKIYDNVNRNYENAKKLASAINENNKEYFNSFDGKKKMDCELNTNEIAGLKGREKAVASLLAKLIYNQRKPYSEDDLFAEIYSVFTKKVREYDINFLKNSGVAKEIDHPVFSVPELSRKIGKHIHPTKDIVGKHTSRLSQDDKNPSNDKGRN
jgi:Ran GTPase-activating protein (RanGAP) involved in mRNA processing and transport